MKSRKLCMRLAGCVLAATVATQTSALPAIAEADTEMENAGASATDIVTGDVNLDGTLNQTDVAMLQQYLLGNLSMTLT